MKKENLIFGAIVVVLLVILIVVVVMLPGKSEKVYEEDLKDINYEMEGNELSMNQYNTENPVVALYIKNYGSVVIELYPDVAPNTVNNFISLVKSGFYDNNTFHRLMTRFVLQGGDPTGTGSGGPGYSIRGEFSSNGFTNNLKHEKGVVSMARADDPDSAGSQFFIMLESADYLDGYYAAFGKVIDGMELVDRIASTERVKDSESGQLQRNLVLEKAVIDLKGKTYPEVEKID